MFDVGKFLETLSGVVNGTGLTEAGSNETLAALFENAGLDPAFLAELPQDQLADLLHSQGIDLAQFGEGQLAEYIDSVGLNALTSELLADPMGPDVREM